MSSSVKMIAKIYALSKVTSAFMQCRLCMKQTGNNLMNVKYSSMLMKSFMLFSIFFADATFSLCPEELTVERQEMISEKATI